MSKRFTDTEKWADPWFRKLPGLYQRLWLFLLDQCDHAGLWKVDIELASFMLGENIDIAKAEKVLSGRIEKINDEKWFIPKFILFQYGELNDKNRAHLSVINLLKKEGLYKPLISPLQGAKDKDKDKDCINSNANTIDYLSKIKGVPEELKRPFCDYLEVYEFNHGKPHQKQIDAIVLSLLRLPADYRLESLTASTMKAHKSICDCRSSFSIAVPESKHETKKESKPIREFGGILESY